MKYYWPLVLIGGTLLILGVALPWGSYCGGWRLFDQPYCTYTTGFDGGGLLPAAGGGSLLLLALISHGGPGSRGLALVISVLCGLLVLGALCIQTEPLAPMVSDAPTYSPAFGFGVSLIGALLCICGSVLQVSEDDLSDKAGILLLAVVELFTICIGMALITRPILGNWLGLWPTYLPQAPCGLASVNGTATPLRMEQMAQCYAAATAKAIELTPPPWWPLGH